MILFITRIKRSGYNPFSFLSKKQPGKNYIVFRAASVGEVALIKPLIDYFSVNYKVVLLVNTKSAIEKAKLLYNNIETTFAPLDFSLCVRKFYAIYQPMLVLLVEQELWPNFILNCPAEVILVNARIKPETAKKYLKLRYFFSKILSNFKMIFSSNSFSHTFFSSIAPEKSKLIGNLKVDAITAGVRKRTAHDTITISITNTHDPEEKILCDILINLIKTKPNLQIILAPRHVNRAGKIKEHYNSKGMNLEYFTNTPHNLCIVDKIGILQQVYELTDIAILGGSLINKGGHNFLEAAAFGCAIIQGPHFSNFYDETVYFAKRNAILIPQNYKEFEMNLLSLVSNPAKIQQLGRNAKEALKEIQGVSNKMIDEISSLIRR
ncbi:MAG: hypothetical protein HY606_00160 [Planctomycetes bacterium]|nr:hypothetical protein [Planctomycetota bacterium]